MRNERGKRFKDTSLLTDRPIGSINIQRGANQRSDGLFPIFTDRRVNPKLLRNELKTVSKLHKGPGGFRPILTRRAAEYLTQNGVEQKPSHPLRPVLNHGIQKSFTRSVGFRIGPPEFRLLEVKAIHGGISDP